LKQHGPGVHHIAFEVDDLTKQIGHFTGLGVLPQDSQPTPGAGPYVLLNLPPAALGGFLSQLIQSTTKEDA
jgi:methylmalonyl-CoA/ethylmalonyl-CoA epimerase